MDIDHKVINFLNWYRESDQIFAPSVMIQTTIKGTCSSFFMF